MRQLIPTTCLAALIIALCAGLALSPTLSGAAAPRNLGRAIEAQRALVVERPADSAVQNDLGSLLVLADDLEGAEQAYRAAIALDGANAAAHFNLGLLLQKRDDRRAALKEFKRTLELEPKNAWAHYQAGTIYEHWGIASAAKKAYAKALAIDPSLGNPEVNPHLIDNQLATSAMLYSYHHYRDELLPEKRFEEPARIAGVLIDRPQAAGEAAPVQAESTTEGGFPRPGGTQVESRTVPAQAETPDSAEGDASASRVLSNKDLDPGAATNQVGGRGGPSVVGAPGNAGGRNTPARSRTRDPKPTTPPVRPTLRGPNSGNPPMAPPPTGFLPTGDSTGMMETRLVEIGELS